MGGLNAKGDKGREVTSRRGGFWLVRAGGESRRRIAADLWTLMGSSRLYGIISGATFPGLPQGIYYSSAATCWWRPRGPWGPSVCGIAPRHLHGLGYGTSCGDYVNLGLGNICLYGVCLNWRSYVRVFVFVCGRTSMSDVHIFGFTVDINNCIHSAGVTSLLYILFHVGCGSITRLSVKKTVYSFIEARSGGGAVRSGDRSARAP